MTGVLFSNTAKQVYSASHENVREVFLEAICILSESSTSFILKVNDEIGTTMVLIEHDMGVVMDISDSVVVLDYGKTLADGTPTEIRSNQAVIDAYLGVAHD